MKSIHRVELTSKIWDCDHINLNISQKVILLALAWHSDGKEKPIPVSIGRLSRLTHIGNQAVERNVRELIREGYIERTKLHTSNDPAEYVFVENRLKLCGK